MRNRSEEAERLHHLSLHLAELLPKKVHAYGAAHLVQAQVWEALLRPYRCEVSDDGAWEYQLPEALVAVMPRLTRALDRVCRIVANPALDPMGENPWLDLAGDALAGASLAEQLGAGGALAMRDGLPMQVPAGPVMVGGDEWRTDGH